MAYDVITTTDREYEVVDPPTGKQQREVNELLLRCPFVADQRKRELCEAYGWTERYFDDEGFSLPEEADLLTLEDFRVRCAQIIFEGFDKPLSDDTRDHIIPGDVEDGRTDFFNACGGQKSGPQPSSNDLMEFLSALSDQTNPTTGKS